MAEVKEGLSSLDSHGHRIFIIPAEVSGFFRTYRNVVQTVLIFVFLIIPWTKINGVQTLLFDLPNRKFSIFGVQFYAHDGPLIFFILATLTIGLAAVTAVWGRVWCGWGCPQTVFIEGVYRRIERLIEGNYIARRKLRDQELNFEKFWKTSVKWFLYLVVSSVIAHSFIAYFTGSDQLIRMIQGSPTENWSYFLVVSFMTAVLLFDFGWFREQFCIIMCPYGRFQSVLMDSRSLTVMYDSKRGEPRKSSGDCVACNRCVQVCPTGIDIRNGAQMECIGCTACIDACDEIMTKVHKPKGLIRYDSLRGTGVDFKRPRVAVYIILILVAISALVYNFADRSRFMVTMMRATEVPYQLVPQPDGTRNVINHFKVHIHNQTFVNQSYRIEEPLDWSANKVQLTLPTKLWVVPAGDEKIIHFFVIFPESYLQGKGQLSANISVFDESTGEEMKKALTLVGP